jgi:hypothetical protein
MEAEIAGEGRFQGVIGLFEYHEYLILYMTLLAKCFQRLQRVARNYGNAYISSSICEQGEKP